MVNAEQGETIPCYVHPVLVGTTIYYRLNMLYRSTFTWNGLKTSHTLSHSRMRKGATQTFDWHCINHLIIIICILYLPVSINRKVQLRMTGMSLVLEVFDHMGQIQFWCEDMCYVSPKGYVMQRRTEVIFIGIHSIHNNGVMSSLAKWHHQAKACI